jgi:EpsI family protein
MNLIRSRYALILTVVLLLQGGFFYLVAERQEVVPEMVPLDGLPNRIGSFEALKSVNIDQETRDLLRADDLLYRQYADSSSGQRVDLFVAYFKTQRYGQSPHSPKNCLPGSGWQSLGTDRPVIQLNGGPGSIQVNRYIVQKGEDTGVTMYWYQTHSRVIASEYWAKFWLVADALRYHRSDTALVRVTIPVTSSEVDKATASGVEFIRAVFPELQRIMPI